MNKLPAAPESFQDFTFPVSGVDTSNEYSGQRAGTTAIGQNCRAYEPSTQRARGGARPGLSRWFPAQLLGATEVQNLDIIVTTTPLSQVTPAAPTATVSGTVPTILVQSSPEAQTGTSLTDASQGNGTLDPSSGGRNLLADGSIRRVRTGGSGLPSDRTILPNPVSDGTTALDAGVVQFFALQAIKGGNPANPIGVKIPMKPIKKGNVIVLAVAGCEDDADLTTGVSDSQGNSYTQQSSKDDASDSPRATMRVFTAPVTADGANALTVTASAAAKIAILEVTPPSQNYAITAQPQTEASLGTGSNDYGGNITVTKPSFGISAWLIETTGISSVTTNYALTVNQPATTGTGYGIIVVTGVVQPGAPLFFKSMTVVATGLARAVGGIVVLG